jgi:hypothetical protein
MPLAPAAALRSHGGSALGRRHRLRAALTHRLPVDYARRRRLVDYARRAGWTRVNHCIGFELMSNGFMCSALGVANIQGNQIVRRQTYTGSRIMRRRQAGQSRDHAVGHLAREVMALRLQECQRIERVADFRFGRQGRGALLVQLGIGRRGATPKLDHQRRQSGQQITGLPKQVDTSPVSTRSRITAT